MFRLFALLVAVSLCMNVGASGQSRDTNQQTQEAVQEAERAAELADEAGEHARRAANAARNATEQTQHGDDQRETREGPRHGRFEQVNEGTANNIRGTLSTMTEAALTKGQFRSVVQRLAEPAQERIGDYARQEFEILDARISRFRQDWEARYGQEFSIDNRDLVYSAQLVQIYRGRIDEAQLAAERPPADRHEQAEPPAIDQQQQQRTNTAAREDQDADERETATLVMPAEFGLPEVTIHLVNEGTILDAWRIEAPEHVDGPTLQENLLLHLTVANERKEQWPADVNDAYRMVTHHVLMAVMGMPPEQDREARPAGQRQPGGEQRDQREPQREPVGTPQQDQPRN